jgi:hypothetical protein
MSVVVGGVARNIKGGIVRQSREDSLEWREF